MKTKIMTVLSIALLAIALLASTARPAVAAPPPYKGFGWGWCTWYAATEFDRVAPAPKLNWRGNAAQWYDNAYSAGWAVDRNPAAAAARPGSIIVWTGGVNNWGHVGIVRGAASGKLVVDEMNVRGFGVVSRTSFPLTNLSRSWSSGGRRYTLTYRGCILPARR